LEIFDAYVDAVFGATAIYHKGTSYVEVKGITALPQVYILKGDHNTTTKVYLSKKVNNEGQGNSLRGGAL
jgi:hypothetical protein